MAVITFDMLSLASLFHDLLITPYSLAWDMEVGHHSQRRRKEQQLRRDCRPPQPCGHHTMYLTLENSS
eukprot:2599856-Amphidinium_carterae.1